jgi:hypothetical protein
MLSINERKSLLISSPFSYAVMSKSSSSLPTMTSMTTGDTNLLPVEANEGGGGNQNSWEGCSLCSGTATDDDLDNDDLVPIPGRESHTSDIDQYLLYVAELKNRNDGLMWISRFMSNFGKF